MMQMKTLTSCANSQQIQLPIQIPFSEAVVLIVQFRRTIWLLSEGMNTKWIKIGHLMTTNLEKERVL